MEPPVRIAWDNVTVKEWADLLRAAGRSTLTQSFAYASAIVQTERQKTVVGVVELDDRAIGIVAAQFRRVMGLAEQVSLSRGPLLIPGVGAPMGLSDQMLMDGALRAIRARFAPAATRWLAFIPELPSGPESDAMLRSAGFRRSGHETYRTIWIDLSQPLAQCRKGLHQKWRNRLTRAEQARTEGRMTISVDPQAKSLPALARAYDADRKARGYRGPSAELVIRLRNGLWQANASLQITAEIDGALAAGILVVGHGASATYQIGWTSEAGRALSATHLCLWTAIETLQAAGFRWFDLGGIDPDGAPGLTRFKRGLGGDEVALCGTWV